MSPTENIIPLDIRDVNVELFSFVFNFILGDHLGLINRKNYGKWKQKCTHLNSR